jgi:mono/diheme cytochrome c family protein
MTTFNAEHAEPAETSFMAVIANAWSWPAGKTRSACSAVSALIVVTGLSLSGAACRQDMHDQPKYIPLRESTFFSDARSARPIVPGTVARGQLREDTLLYTGKVGTADATMFPFPVDDTVMARGQDRYNIYCSPCHARTGEGDGMIVRRGYRRPPSLHQDRLREAPVGHFFDVISNGFGAMPEYATQISAEDRWAVIAYVRALQLAAHATVNDVPPDRRGQLDQLAQVPR